ncbi:MAG: class I SAM-dependent DNA methyltransferase [Candidatus Micrarchaeia archaeon]
MVYDEFLRKAVPVSLLFSLFKLQKARFGRVLDLGCGTGLFLRKIQTCGGSGVGVDISEKMLEIARSNLDSDNFVLLKKDMLKISFKHEFDLVSCLYDSVNYVTDKRKLLSLFKKVFRALKPKGVFVFDFNTLKKKASGSIQKEISIDKRKINLKSYYRGNFWFLEISVIENGREFVEIHKERLYSRKDIVPLLREAGFSKLLFFDGFSKRAAKPSSKRLLVLAKVL